MILVFEEVLNALRHDDLITQSGHVEVDLRALIVLLGVTAHMELETTAGMKALFIGSLLWSL